VAKRAHRDNDSTCLTRLQASLQPKRAAQRTQDNTRGKRSRTADSHTVTTPLNSPTTGETESEAELTDPAESSQTPYIAVTINFNAWGNVLLREADAQAAQLTKKDTNKICKAYGQTLSGKNKSFSTRSSLVSCRFAPRPSHKFAVANGALPSNQ
jgi:hypothetical protein